MSAESANQPGYYSAKLAAERLRQCYDLAPPRVRQYLEAETEHVIARIRPGDHVLEVGCGYGRVLEQLARRAGLAVGIDTSHPSLMLARKLLDGLDGCRLVEMDAARLGFADGAFDLVACIQNGISAFKVDRSRLIQEACRVTRDGGLVMLSSYAERFWGPRLEWFRLQSGAGLLGEIDPARTGNGEIVCKDGFSASTISPKEFRTLTSSIGYPVRIEEVDGASLFCEIQVQRPATAGIDAADKSAPV